MIGGNILYCGTITNAETPKYVGKLVNKILNDFEDGNDYMNAEEYNSLTEKGIKLLYQLAEYIPEEIKILLDNLLIENEDENNKIIKKKDKQIKYALSHFHSGTLPKYFPNELIALANLKWKYKKVKSKSEFGFEYYESEIEHHFGITNKHNFKYFPESAYQTFVYEFLRSNPWKALDFIIDFTNYCAEKYVKSNFLKDDGFRIDILYNEKTYSIYGSSYLWLVNRGGSIKAPDLLQSIVVALEKYLYELGKTELENIDEIIQSFFDKIYTKSNSVILISVLSSIAMAYPKKVGDKLLPFISDKNFFDWDRYRWIRDQKNYVLGGTFNAHSKICTQERQEALKWEHRKKYDKGLTGFLIEFQILYGNFNGKLFEIFDFMERKHDKKDIYFLKLLSEIDIRKHKIEHNGNLAIQISPNYSVDLSLEKEMQKNEEQSNFQNEYSKYSLWVSQTFQKKSEENVTYEYWKECFEYYRNYDKSKIDFFNDFPIGTLSTLGLDLFSGNLNDNEFEFCINTILETAQKLFEKEKKKNFDLSISIYDKDPVYGSLPKLLLFKNRLSEQQLNDIKTLVFFFLKDIPPEQDIHLKHLYNSFKKNVWNIDYQFAYNCFFGLILYAEFFKKHPRHKSYSEEDIKTIQEEENEILNFIENNESDYELTNLSYSKFSHWELDKVVHIFPIYEEFDFSYIFLKLIFNAQIESYSFEGDRYSSIRFTIKETIIDFLFEIPFNEKTKSFFEFIINTGINFIPDKRKDYDVIKYIRETIESFYYKVNDNPDSERMLKNLWSFWEILYAKVKNETKLFNQELLFYGRYWKYKEDSWFVLKNDNVASTYLKKIENLDYLNVEALIQLLSGIGFQSLMPQGIKVLTRHLKFDLKQILNINYDYGEKLITRCLKDKIKVIKEDKSLLDEFFWFLNLMVDIGSSKAYYIRENLILYKKYN